MKKNMAALLVVIAIVVLLAAVSLTFSSGTDSPRGQESALSNDDYETLVTEAVNMAAVLEYVRAYNERDEDAMRAAFAPVLVQHAPNVPDGVEGLTSFNLMEFEDLPDPHVDVRRVFADGDLVALHSHFLFDRRDLGDDKGDGYARISLFRLEDGLIAEHWSVSQPVNQSFTSPNGNSLFDGAVNLRTKIDNAEKDPAREPEGRDVIEYLAMANSGHKERLRQVVLEYSREFFDEGNFDGARLRELVAEDLIQHNPGEDNGLDGLIEVIKPLKEQFPAFGGNVKKVLVDGQFVVTQVHYAPMGSTDYTSGGHYFDIYRVVNGTIVEHWDVGGDPEPRRSQKSRRQREFCNLKFGFTKIIIYRKFA